MNVVNVRITGRPEGECLCVVAFDLESEDFRYRVTNLRIIENDKGRFLAMPSIRTNSGWKDIFYPCDRRTRDYIERIVLDHYKNNL